MNVLLRSLLALLVIGGALLTSYRFAPHHQGANHFETLYLHLTPSALVKDNLAPHEEHEALIAIPLPAFLSGFGTVLQEGFEGHGEVEGTGEVEHATWHLTLNNLTIFKLAAVALCFVMFFGLGAAIRSGRGDKLTRIFGGWAMWIRDEMVYPVMGKEEGRRWLPYFLCVFFFLAFINLMGLLPFSFTPTASIYVTGAMALTTLFAMIGSGMVAQGPLAYWKNLVPHVPLALWPLMFVVELIGLFVKPFALMIRLFANMSGGHMVVLSFMGLIFYFGGAYGAGAGYAVAPIAVGFAAFIMIIECFVALLQAYIFTQLSILFVGASIHPEH